MEKVLAPLSISETTPNFDLTRGVGGNKRRHLRKPVFWSVEGEWKDGTKFIGKTINISQAGIMMSI